MPRALINCITVSAILLVGSLAAAQTTQPGDAIDVEIYNPADGTNRFCVAPSGTISVRVFARPGTDSMTCQLSCGPNVPGGSANIATGVIDIEFDNAILNYVGGSTGNNPATAAEQGIAQEQNTGDGRVGWALAGGWSTPGNPASTLLSPCEMEMITTADWIYEFQFDAIGTGMTTLHLRRETDSSPFALSFADICGSLAFKESTGMIDEVRNAVVLVTSDCNDVLFFDSFGNGDTQQWSSSSGS